MLWGPNLSSQSGPSCSPEAQKWAHFATSELTCCSLSRPLHANKSGEQRRLIEPLFGRIVLFQRHNLGPKLAACLRAGLTFARPPSSQSGPKTGQLVSQVSLSRIEWAHLGAIRCRNATRCAICIIARARHQSERASQVSK